MLPFQLEKWVGNNGRRMKFELAASSFAPSVLHRSMNKLFGTETCRCISNVFKSKLRENMYIWVTPEEFALRASTLYGTRRLTYRYKLYI